MKILILEDDPTLRESLINLLNQHGYEGIAMEHFLHPMEDIQKENPDLILLDWMLPGVDGSYLLREIRKNSSIPVIMLTSKNTTLDEVISMSYGADDYIAKPYEPQVLLLRIEAILRRTHALQSKLTYHTLTLNLAKSTLEHGDQIISLSKNELMIFHYLLNHEGAIVAREALMTYLWDTEEFIDDNTLTVNVNRLRSKLEELGYPDCIETRRGQGYLLL